MLKIFRQTLTNEANSTLFYTSFENISKIRERRLEINGKTFYPTHTTWRGNETEANLFEAPDGQKRVVIQALDQYVCNTPLNETLINLKLRKHIFWEHMYGDTFLLREDNNFILVVPYVEGTLGIEVKFHDTISKIEFALALVNALIYLHNKGLKHNDIKEDNVIYNEQTKTAYFIDGGLATVDGEVLPENFSVISHAQAAQFKTLCSHIAPECWSIAPNPPNMATDKMDIYSLAKLLQRPFFINNYYNDNIYMDIENQLNVILTPCLQKNPDNRPSLLVIRDSIYELLLAAQQRQEFQEAQDIELCNYLNESKSADTTDDHIKSMIKYIQAAESLESDDFIDPYRHVVTPDINLGRVSNALYANSIFVREPNETKQSAITSPARTIKTRPVNTLRLAMSHNIFRKGKSIKNDSKEPDFIKANP